MNTHFYDVQGLFSRPLLHHVQLMLRKSFHSYKWPSSLSLEWYVQGSCLNATCLRSASQKKTRTSTNILQTYKCCFCNPHATQHGKLRDKKLPDLPSLQAELKTLYQTNSLVHAEEVIYRESWGLKAALGLIKRKGRRWEITKELWLQCALAIGVLLWNCVFFLRTVKLTF